MEFAEFIKTPMVDRVNLRKPFCKPVEGTLCITGHHLILSSRQTNREELWLLHSSVDSVEKRLSGSGGVVMIRCKDFTRLALDIPTAEECLNVAQSIEQLSHIDDITLAYPFFYRPTFDILEDGWHAFHQESEKNRYKSLLKEDWRISTANKEYRLCQSYPQSLFVPKAVTDEMLVKVAQFRQNGRFPVLSYYHRESKAVLMRCSQPLTGASGKRCKDDEKLVNAVLGIGVRGYIIDTRSQTLAKLEMKTGGGYEPEAHYSQWKRINQSIERRPVFHESLIKLIEACSDTSATQDKWLSKLESSGWLSHVKDILTCACLVAQCVDKDAACVLVHGSEGMDTTLQVTSLAQVIMDPDCRTFTGFEALIEREWLQAGHPFTDRCAKSAHAITKQRQESPVFLLFLDCVWQIWQQFPCSFEFTEDFLILLFEHAYSSQFGTFLCNSDLERRCLKLESRTVSLWSYLNRPEVLGRYINPMYDPNPMVIWPSVAPQSLLLWNGLFLRSHINQCKQEEAWTEVAKIRQYDKELRSKVTKLRRHLVCLEKEATAAGVILPATLDGDVNGCVKN
ncbi:myotubularin-related protein 9-like [Mya arenaria]|uniref:myotubularin-related protein 9-like n=1 Tax=Mya arenaria TaxID=6604 RepID=UPI0022E6F11F|nr:myotubularin-related protein 9-like [Mya arenaria]